MKLDLGVQMVLGAARRFIVIVLMFSSILRWEIIVMKSISNYWFVEFLKNNTNNCSQKNIRFVAKWNQGSVSRHKTTSLLQREGGEEAEGGG